MKFKPILIAALFATPAAAQEAPKVNSAEMKAMMAPFQKCLSDMLKGVTEKEVAFKVAQFTCAEDDKRLQAQLKKIVLSQDLKSANRQAEADLSATRITRMLRAKAYWDAGFLPDGVRRPRGSKAAPQQ